MTSMLKPLTGRYWRMIHVRWQREPFASGSHLTGGRWNPPGTPALYLGRSYNTAIAEAYQQLVRPLTLVGYDVEASAIADLTDPAMLEKAGQDRGGVNLVLWRWHDSCDAGEGATLTLLDPDRVLTGGGG